MREHQVALEAHLPFRDLVYRTVRPHGIPDLRPHQRQPFFDETGSFSAIGCQHGHHGDNPGQPGRTSPAPRPRRNLHM